MLGNTCLLLYALSICTINQIAWAQNPMFTGQKTSEFLKAKFSNYDKAVRPNFGDKPVVVTVSGFVLDIFDIDERNQEFTVNLYLRHEWKDPRLEFTETEAGTDKLILNDEYVKKIWKVDSFIVNERSSTGHNLVLDNEFVRISPDGTVLISTRYTIRAACKMSLGWFPFDRHTCPLVIESYGLSTTDVIYQWKSDEYGNTKRAIGVSEDLYSIMFSVSGVNSRHETITFGQKSYSRLAVEFFLIRASTRFVHEIYFPAILITMISFITLLHATGTPKARLQASIFLEGLLIVLTALSARTVPPASYQTALDFYLFICLLTIFCIILANLSLCLMISNSSETNGVVRLRSVNDDESGNRVEDDGKEILFDTGLQFSSRTSRIITLLIKLRYGIPLIFVLFNLLYWMIVLIGSSSFPDDFLILENNIAN